MLEYAAEDWYWLIGEDAARIWSSRSSSYVGTADPIYAAWAASGGVPTRIPSEQELNDVLAPYGLIGPYQHLQGYAANKRWQIETGGIIVAGAHVQTNRVSQAMITGAYAYAEANPDASINFKAESGWVSLSSAQMTAIGLAVRAHVQACFSAEAAIEADIAAGTITTTAQIDTDTRWPGA